MSKDIVILRILFQIPHLNDNGQKRFVNTHPLPERQSMAMKDKSNSFSLNANKNGNEE
jgi:hypothetical protein